MVPAMFVFGDSIVDVGNNNYLQLSFAKANLPHYGIDFPTKKPTGRYTNGMNPADFLGELIMKSILSFFSIFFKGIKLNLRLVYKFCLLNIMHALYVHVLIYSIVFSM